MGNQSESAHYDGPMVAVDNTSILAWQLDAFGSELLFII